MAYKIIWSPDAISTFENILEYLHENWTTKEVNNFMDDVEQIISLLEKNPYLFRGSEKEHINEALILKHNLLLYHINESNKTVELISFWDTRQNPNKKHSKRK